MIYKYIQIYILMTVPLPETDPDREPELVNGERVTSYLLGENRPGEMIQISTSSKWIAGKLLSIKPNHTPTHIERN